MARPSSFASVVSLGLCVSLAAEAPARAASRLLAHEGPPAETVKVPSPHAQPKREIAPGPGTPGIPIPFAPTGRRWGQAQILVPTEVTPATESTSTAPLLGVVTVRSPTGALVDLAVNPPGEPPPPSLPPRRVAPGNLLAFGIGLFVVSYVATGVGASNHRRDCHRLDDACQRQGATMMIPLAGPILVANHTREPRDYAFAAMQAASLVLTVIAAVLVAAHRQRVLGAQGLRVGRNTAIRPDAGPTGAHVSVRASF